MRIEGACKAQSNNRKAKDVYTLLTAAHVIMANKKESSAVTEDGATHILDKARQLRYKEWTVVC